MDIFLIEVPSHCVKTNMDSKINLEINLVESSERHQSINDKLYWTSLFKLNQIKKLLGRDFEINKPACLDTHDTPLDV